MKIFVDENIPSRTVEELRGLGHDVLDIRGTADQGMDDDVLWARLLHERRLLITTDKGFAQHR
jgi:predicted nuclease of predicted toxin-antitoxin system